MPTPSSFKEYAAFVDDQMAILRGEALAGRVLAAFAIQAIVQHTKQPETVLEDLEKAIDLSLNNLRTSGGDETLNIKAREIARLRATETVAELRRSLQS